MKRHDGDRPVPAPRPDNTTAGMTFVVTVGLAAAAGFWLDRRMGSLPIFTLLGLAFGLGVGGYWLYLRTAQAPRRGPPS
ncbi:MAG: AtpZ/AtpI family protein [Gemmatimonadales bacterium]|nr:AtpZ/AtpI family protein [Gemmatimonadales bacterium]